jgi:hypothetical protein
MPHDRDGRLRVVMAGLDPDLYPQIALGRVVWCKSTAKLMEAAEAGWISPCGLRDGR